MNDNGLCLGRMEARSSDGDSAGLFVYPVNGQAQRVNVPGLADTIPLRITTDSTVGYKFVVSKTVSQVTHLFLVRPPVDSTYTGSAVDMMADAIPTLTDATDRPLDVGQLNSDGRYSGRTLGISNNPQRGFVATADSSWGRNGGTYTLINGDTSGGGSDSLTRPDGDQLRLGIPEADPQSGSPIEFDMTGPSSGGSLSTTDMDFLLTVRASVSGYQVQISLTEWRFGGVGLQMSWQDLSTDYVTYRLGGNNTNLWKYGGVYHGMHAKVEIRKKPNVLVTATNPQFYFDQAAFAFK